MSCVVNYVGLGPRAPSRPLLVSVLLATGLTLTRRSVLLSGVLCSDLAMHVDIPPMSLPSVRMPIKFAIFVELLDMSRPHVVKRRRSLVAMFSIPQPEVSAFPRPLLKGLPLALLFLSVPVMLIHLDLPTAIDVAPIPTAMLTVPLVILFV